jgi:hypothetical protein
MLCNDMSNVAISRAKSEKRRERGAFASCRPRAGSHDLTLLSVFIACSVLHLLPSGESFVVSGVATSTWMLCLPTIFISVHDSTGCGLSSSFTAVTQPSTKP